MKLKTNQPFCGREWQGYSLRELLSQAPEGQYQFWHKGKYQGENWRFIGFLKKGEKLIEYSPEPII